MNYLATFTSLLVVLSSPTFEVSSMSLHPDGIDFGKPIQGFDPNPVCKSELHHGSKITPRSPYVWTDCDAEEHNVFFEVPRNFNVHALHDLVEIFKITGPGVVTSQSDPIPARVQLQTLEVTNMNQRPEDPRFPLRGMLQKNREHIEVIRFFNVKLSYLTRGEFLGYKRLTSLTLQDCGLKRIRPDVFNMLGYSTPVGEALSLTPEYEPVLRYVNFQEKTGAPAVD